MSETAGLNGTRQAGVIDCHSHFLPPSLVAAFERNPQAPRIFAKGGQLYIEYGDGMIRRVTATMLDIETKLAAMDSQGIEAAVVSINVPGLDWFSAPDGVVIARDVNDELADLAAGSGGRIRALAGLPCQAGEAAASELERAISHGIGGGLMFSNVAGRTLDSPELASVFDVAERLGAPIMIHPTYPLCIEAFSGYSLESMVGYLVDTANAVLRLVLSGVLERHPGLKLYLTHAGSFLPYIVGRVDHGAGKFSDEHPLAAKPSDYLRRLYTDTICNWSPALRLALEFFSEDRVMFGTDSPFWDAAVSFATVDELTLSDGQRSKLLSANARELFGFA